MMNTLYTIDEIRRIERSAAAELPPGALMRRAGQSAAELALTLLPADPASNAVLVLAGPGNNGGDALELAASLALSGIHVSVMLYCDERKQSQEAKEALQRARNSPAHWLDTSSVAHVVSAISERPWSLLVDGLFGIGLKQAITGELRILVEAANTLPCPILSLDNPSGLDADTGAITGEHGTAGVAIQASHTITFIGDKPGLHTLHGRDNSGQVHVADLGVSDALFPAPRRWLNSVSLFASCLLKRRHESHKGSFGNAAIIGGAPGMMGAAALASRAALHCGAGRVYTIFLDAAPDYDEQQPELMYRQAQEFDFSSAILTAGPGLGRTPAARDLLARVLDSENAVVLDADALNLLASDPGLQEKVFLRTSGTLMTPHPLEAARLLGTSVAQVQSDRLEAATRLAKQFNSVVVLKGSGSVIAAPDKRIVINTTGNPALATAGSGDVLSGICGALLAQNWPLWETALGAVWMHGAAADELVRQGIGPIGLTAGELIPAVRACLNRLTEANARKST
jgi:hydroxyethylthiazole kinase-like uncharacterized protein yjeF